MGRNKIVDPAKQTMARSIRLTRAEWAELNYAAMLEGVTRNDIVRKRIKAHALAMPTEVIEGQEELSLSDTESQSSDE